MGQSDFEREVHDFLRRRLAMGLEHPSDVGRAAVEVLDSDDAPMDVATVVKAALPSLLRERQAAMRSWPATTDCDRLDAAFEELNEAGVMARHDWTCCGTCGVDETVVEFDRLKGKQCGRPIVGYIFYHQQGTESAAGGESLCMSYGTTRNWKTDEQRQAASLEVARFACRTFVKHGLKVDWNESIDLRVAVLLDWKRRARPARYCESPDFARATERAIGFTPSPATPPPPSVKPWWTRLWPRKPRG